MSRALDLCISRAVGWKVPLIFIPAGTFFKSPGNTFNIEGRLIVSPITKEQEEAIEGGQVRLWVIINFPSSIFGYGPGHSLPGGPGLFPVAKDGTYDPTSNEWTTEARLTKDWLNREITFKCSIGIPDRISTDGGSYILGVGEVFDVHFFTGMNDYATGRAWYGPVYPALYTIGVKATREQVESIITIRDTTPYAQGVLEQIRDIIQVAKLRYTSSVFPGTIAAGEGFSITHQFENYGIPGTARLRLLSDAKETVYELLANKTASLSQSIEMPWDDWGAKYSFTLEAPQLSPVNLTRVFFDSNSYWSKVMSFITDTAEKIVQILAGFPEAVMGDTAAPSRIKIGDAFNIDFPIKNDGYKGDIGVRIRAPGFQSDVMQRVDSGNLITPNFTGEMPAFESCQITAIPIYLGRNKQVVEGIPRVIDIKPMNSLLHLDQSVLFQGGYSEGNTYNGFVAGENVKVSGLDATGGVGPMGYSGYFLSGTLGENGIGEITYDKLYYLKIEMGKEIAIAKRGALIERAVKSYEYSQIPTPTMLSYSFKSMGTLLTRASSKLEVA